MSDLWTIAAKVSVAIDNLIIRCHDHNSCVWQGVQSAVVPLVDRPVGNMVADQLLIDIHSLQERVL